MTDVDRMAVIERSGPWTIDVCEDCGRTRQDMSHGKCSTPTRWRRVEVEPVNQPAGAVEENERLRRELDAAYDNQRDQDYAMAGLRAEIESMRHRLGGQYAKDQAKESA